MNRIHTALAITGLCLSVVGWNVWQQQVPPERQTASNPSSYSSGHTNGQTSTAHSPGLTPGEPSNSEQARQQFLTETQKTESVMGFTVLKDRNCEVEVHYIPDAETGELHETMSCTPTDEQEEHPYASWSEETLAELAYGDAKAAEILGLRHIRSNDPEQETLGLSLIYRSVALSGDPSVFRSAIGTRYATVSVNGKPQIKNLKQLLVFNVMGEMLGDPRFNSLIVERQLKSADISEQEIARLRIGSRGLLKEMADLQSEITGSVSIGEALKNV